MPGMAAGGRILLAYLIYFAALGAAFPYLPVFYHDIGLGLEQIGILTALQAAMQLLLAPVWGGLADRFPHTRVTLPLAAAVATVGATLLFRATDFPTVLVGSLILYAGMSGIAPTLDARTLETLGTDGRSRYGEVRAFGSLAFVLATLAVGFVLDAEGARALFWVYIPFLIGTVVVTATIPRRGTSHLGQPPARRGPVPGDAGVALFLVGFTVVWASLAAVNAFYSIQIVALGGSAGLVGIAWASGPASRSRSCTPSRGSARRVGTERLVVFGALAFALRALLGVARRGPGGARPDRPARGHRVRVRLRRRRDRPRGAGAGESPGDGAGTVRRRAAGWPRSSARSRVAPSPRPSISPGSSWSAPAAASSARRSWLWRSSARALRLRLATAA